MKIRCEGTIRHEGMGQAWAQLSYKFRGVKQKFGSLWFKLDLTTGTFMNYHTPKRPNFVTFCPHFAPYWGVGGRAPPGPFLPCAYDSYWASMSKTIFHLGLAFLNSYQTLVFSYLYIHLWVIDKTTRFECWEWWKQDWNMKWINSIALRWMKRNLL